MTRTGWWVAVLTAIFPTAAHAEDRAAQIQLDVVLAEVKPEAEAALAQLGEGGPAEQNVRVLTAADGERVREALQVLKGQGQVKVLGEPRLVTLSGRPASFLCGGEFPVPYPGGVEFVEFGTRANFAPRLQASGKIYLEAALEHKALKATPACPQAPEQNTSRLRAATDLAPGQTLMVFGPAKDQRRVLLVTPSLLAPPPVAVQADLLAVKHEAAPAKEADRAAGPFRVEAANGRVHIRCRHFQATADRLSQDGNQFVLEGKVCLVRDATQIELLAEKVVVRVEGDRVQIQAAGPDAGRK